MRSAYDERNQHQAMYIYTNCKCLARLKHDLHLDRLETGTRGDGCNTRNRRLGCHLSDATCPCRSRTCAVSSPAQGCQEEDEEGEGEGGGGKGERGRLPLDTRAPVRVQGTARI
jgi:hypothetical protein